GSLRSARVSHPYQFNQIHDRPTDLRGRHNSGRRSMSFNPRSSCSANNKSGSPGSALRSDHVPNVSRIARVRHALVNGHRFGGSVAALVIGDIRDYLISEPKSLQTLGVLLLSATLVAL